MKSSPILNQKRLAEFLRHVIAREVEKLDAEKLVDAVNALGLGKEQIESHCEGFFSPTPVKQRIVLSLDAVDAFWVTRAMGAMERRGKIRDSASGLNGKAVTQICLEWMGAMDREGKL